MAIIDEDRTLPSGRVVTLRMPNMYKLMATSRGVPNPALAAVLKLLAGEGNSEASNELQRLQGMQSQVRGLYEVAKLCLVQPVLRLDLKDDELPGPGEIGPDDLPLADAEVIYFSFFRIGPRAGLGPRTDQPESIANIGSNSTAVPLPTE